MGDLDFGARRVRVDFSRPLPLAIPLDPHGRQPRFFTDEPARSEPMRSGDFTGSVRRGGSCNAEYVRLAPHGHGTHTEGIGHLLPSASPVLETVYPGPAGALLVSLRAGGANGTGLTAADLRAHLDIGWVDGIEALVIRTLPNEPSKAWRDYSHATYPVFEPDAMDLLAGMPLKHLLIDAPSLDPAHDGGRLANHRRWWGLEGDAPRGVEAHRRSVTEMIYVPDSIEDGLYWLHLELAPLVSDATPSRPVLYPLETPG